MIQIFYLGHACYYIKGKQSASILLDPFDPSIGYEFPQISPDIVLISNDHFEHNMISLLPDTCAVIKHAGEKRVGKIVVNSVAYPKNNLLFSFKHNGIHFCHLGRLAQEVDPRQFKKWIKEQEIDVLFLPVGGNKVIGIKEAWQIVEELKPRVVFPMLYRTEVCPLQKYTLEDFIKGKKVYPLTNSSIKIDRTWLKSLEPKTIMPIAFNRLEKLRESF